MVSSNKNADDAIFNDLNILANNFQNNKYIIDNNFLNKEIDNSNIIKINNHEKNITE